MKINSFGPLCGAGGESTLEFLDLPLGTGLSREPFSHPLLFQGARTTPPSPRTDLFSPSQVLGRSGPLGPVQGTSTSAGCATPKRNRQCERAYNTNGSACLNVDTRPCARSVGGPAGGGWSRAIIYCNIPQQSGDHFDVHMLLLLRGGINGQVAVSALGSSCAWPTAFITFCPSWCLQRIQFHRHVQPAPSLNGWGCDLQDSIGLGVHPGQWALLHQVLLLAGSHLALPGCGWLLVLRGGGGLGRGGGMRVRIKNFHIFQSFMNSASDLSIWRMHTSGEHTFQPTLPQPTQKNSPTLRRPPCQPQSELPKLRSDNF